jgi:NitT/TauT family transport system substrate-binding protein
LETTVRRHEGNTMTLAIAALAVLISAACSASAAGEERSRAKLTKVTVAVPAPSELFNLPVVLADRLGFFADEGLDVRLVDVGAGTNALQAVLAGEAQAASGFAGHTITMAAKGQAIRSFVTTVNAPGMALVVSPRPSRPITAVADLEGAAVGVSAPGSDRKSVV